MWKSLPIDEQEVRTLGKALRTSIDVRDMGLGVRIVWTGKFVADSIG